MGNFETNIIKALSSIYRFRKLYLIFLDFLCILFSVLCAIFFTSSNLEFDTLNSYTLILGFIAIPIYYVSGQYKGLSGYLGSGELYKIIGRITVTITLFFFIN